MGTVEEIENLKSTLFSSTTWEERKASSDRLYEIGGQENIDYLLALLDKQNVLVRNAVAMTFMDNKFDQALEPLLKSINKPENRNARGTLVYALQGLDCSQKLRELFYILFTASKNWEVQSGILTVLDEQEFEFSEKDLLDIKEKWETLKNSWNEVNNIDESNLKEYKIDRNIVQSFVDTYLSYLEK